MRWMILWVLILTAVGLSLVVTISPDKPSKVTLVYCLDSSSSLSREDRHEMLQKATYEKLSHEQIGSEWISFGSHVRRLANLPGQLLPESSTDIAGAVQLALTLIERRGYPGKIALFTDGSGIDDFPSIVDACKRSSVPVYVWYPPARTKEWKLVALEVPEKIDEGVQIPLTVRYTSNFHGSVSLKIFANDSLYLQQQIEVDPNEHGLIALQGSPLPKGPVYLSALATGDLREENNRGFAFTSVVSAPKVLLLTNEENACIRQALLAQNIPIITANWHKPPMIQDNPVVILHCPQQPLVQSELWETYLREGGSILVCDADSLELPWLPATPKKRAVQPPQPKEVEKISPPLKQKAVDVEVEMRRTAILFLIDHSQSMSGEKLLLAQQATFLSIVKLLPQDWIGVIAFDTEPTWVIPLGQNMDMNWVSRCLANITLGGGTALAPALKESHRALNGISAHIKHVILLSDGQDENGIYAQNLMHPLVEEMRKARISISTVGIGRDFDAVLMPLIARWGNGEFYYVADANNLPQIVVRDVDRILSLRKLQEKSPKAPLKNKIELPPERSSLPPEPQIPVPTFPSLVREFEVKNVSKGDFLADFPKLPGLDKYHLYQGRNSAITELIVSDDPLLIHWQRYSGNVMMWNADVSTWSNWPSYPQFWARLVRSLAASSLTQPHFSLRSLTPRDNLVPVRLTMYSQENEEYLTIQSQHIFYRCGDGEWEALVPIGDKEVWQNIQVEIKQKGKTIASLHTAFARPYEQEVADLHIPRSQLQELAQKTGGGELPRDCGRFYQLPVSGGTKWEKLRQKITGLELWLLWISLFCCLAWIFTTS